MPKAMPLLAIGCALALFGCARVGRPRVAPSLTPPSGPQLLVSNRTKDPVAVVPWEGAQSVTLLPLSTRTLQTSGGPRPPWRVVVRNERTGATLHEETIRAGSRPALVIGERGVARIRRSDRYASKGPRPATSPTPQGGGKP